VDERGFSEFLEDRGLSTGQIQGQIAAVGALEAFLAARRPPKGLKTVFAQDVDAFSQHLIEQQRNAREIYMALMHYGRFSGHHPLAVRAIELIDGAEALDRLFEKLAEAIGKRERDRVLEGLSLPPLGAPLSQRPPITRAILQRLEERVDRRVWTQILSSGLRDLKDAWYSDAKRLFFSSDDIDDYLERKGRAFLAELRELQQTGSLYFTQEVTDAVIAFVEREPEIRQGVRKGSVLYETKIPYMANAYLSETDDRLKPYWACHCPWVRESLRGHGTPVSPEFCRCSAAFHKRPWEVIFGRPLFAEVVETVLGGAQRCRFAIQLPPEALLTHPTGPRA
jgi:hypothetical protein